MRKLTVIGVLFAVGGVSAGGAMFYQLANSGETVLERELEPGGERQRKMHVASFEVELTPAMNPLAMNLSVDDNSAGGTVTVFDSAGNEVFTRTQNSNTDGGGPAIWFFAPIEVQSAGTHRFVCKIGGGVEAAVHLRRNAFLIPMGVAFGGFGLAIVGFGLVTVSILRGDYSKVERVPLREDWDD